MEKSKRVKIIVALAVIGIAIASVVGVLLIKSNERDSEADKEFKIFSDAVDNWVYVSDFDPYYKDYQVVAKIALRYRYLLDGKKYYAIMTDYQNDDASLYVLDDSFGDDGKVMLDSSEQHSLNRVYGSYDSGFTFTCIYVYKDKVEFQIDEDRYAVVYSVDGSRPNSLDESPQKGYRYRVTKLKDRWYNVKGIPTD